MGGFILSFLLSTANSQASDEPKPMSPAEIYESLNNSHSKAEQEFSYLYSAAKTDDERLKVQNELGVKARPDQYSGKFLSLIKSYPKDPAALKATSWLLGYLPRQNETEQAIEIVIREWIEDQRLETICLPL